MHARIRWLGGESELREALEPVLLNPHPPHPDCPDGDGPQRDFPHATLLRERSARRRHVRLRLASGESLFVKHFLAGGGGRGRLAVALGCAAPQREWRALRRLHRMGVAVPVPRALGILPNGSAVLATRWLDGKTLADALPRDRVERRGLLTELGGLVARLHATGFAHRDLHAGNVLVTGRGPFLLDLQAARATRSRLAHRRDLGALDHSLTRALSSADRTRLRRAGLGLGRPLSPATRWELRRVGRASAAHARSHAASRTRRARRPGRRYAALRHGLQCGLRLRVLQEGTIAEAIAAHGRARGDAVLKRDARARVTAVTAGGRRAIVKEYRAAGPWRLVADLFRGSAGRRAWRGGHGLLVRGIGAATPLAFLERRRLGLPVTSLVVLEDLRPMRPADAWSTEAGGAAEVADALARLGIALHRARVVHGDLKASHVYLGRCDGRLEARLLDLDGVRFPRRLSDRARIQALAELNASMPDSLPASARRRAFARYAAALPFDCGSAAALRRIVGISLSRAHRWTGADCSLAQRRGPVRGGRYDPVMAIQRK